MGLRIKSFIITFFMITGFAAITNAAWEGPVEIISGTWGSGNDQFGITYQDTSDFLPDFNLTTEQKVVIRDGTNKRVKIYNTSGALELIVPYKANLSYKDLTIADSYGFSGDFVGYGEGGINYFYRADQKSYSLYSPTGQLIRTVTERPLELGRVKEKKTAAGYTYTIQYPDLVNPNNVKTYTVNVEGILGKFMGKFQRNSTGYLYGIFGKNVVRFDEQGNIAAQMEVTASEYGVREKDPFGASTRRPIIAQYGEPVIAPNGDVYTWKRTPDRYSIIKWTWR